MACSTLFNYINLFFCTLEMVDLEGEDKYYINNSISEE